MNKYCYILMFSLILVSCHSGSSNKNSSRVSSGSGYVYKLDKLSPYCTRTVTQIDTLITYLEEYPRDIAIHNGCLCVAMAKADTCLYIYDKVTGDFLKCMGVLGEGPEDVIYPEFVENNFELDGNRLMMYDSNCRKQFYLNNEMELEGFTSINSLYANMNCVNMSDYYAVGQPLKGETALFQIINRQTGDVKYVDLYPQLDQSVSEELKNNLSYVYSPNILCNFKKNRIMLAMYFFDSMQCYDLTGRQINTYSFDKQYDASSSIKGMKNGQDYMGYSQCYATKDNCYFRLVLNDGRTHNIKENLIVKTDWDGNVVDVIDLGVLLCGGFCVENDELYCITRGIENEEEVYYILKFEL